MVAATKKRRGRPRVFSYLELICTDMDEMGGLPDSNRGRTNRKYSEIGLDTVCEVIDPDIDPDDNTVLDLFGWGRITKVGVLEQIGRIKHSGLFSDEEINFIVKRAVELIEQGYKSKEIENELRQYRISKKGRNHEKES